MAESLDDAEFWLPPHFLADDNKVLAFGSDRSSSRFPFEFPSDPSSPVESVICSSETESDEGDYMAGLTLQIARSTLDDGFKSPTDSAFAFENGKPWSALSGSPQSTLCALGSGSGCGCQSRGSPNQAHSQVSSPPPLPMSTSTWDLLNAAAGEIANMRIMSQSNNNEEEYYKFLHGRPGGLLNASGKPSFVNPSAESFLNEAVSQIHTQFQHQIQQQMMKQQQSSATWGNNNTWAKSAGWYHQNHQTAVQNRARNQTGRPLGLSPSAWPSMQQQRQQSLQNGSGMRAVFLRNPLGKTECPGTGVFLPRQVGTQPETRRKPACSTVLVPARVVQALNLNLGDMCGGAQPQIQPQYNGRYTLDTAATLRLRNNNAVSHQKRNIGRSQPQANNEIRLPHDWTY